MLGTHPFGHPDHEGQALALGRNIGQTESGFLLRFTTALQRLHNGPTCHRNTPMTPASRVGSMSTAEGSMNASYMYGCRAVQQPCTFVTAASVMTHLWGKYRRGNDQRGLLQRRRGGSNGSIRERAEWTGL